MKKRMAVLVFGLVAAMAARAQEKTQWKELHDFHAVMSSTFHPAEDGNLQPIRSRSQEMVNKAAAWKKSDAPAGYTKKAVEASLKKLVAGAKKLNRMVKENAADKELLTELTSLHDIFHEIMDKSRN
jgi:hypothetical protein